MNAVHSRDRNDGLPTTTTIPDTKPMYDVRGGTMYHPPLSEQKMLSRAQRFEDEKRRIIRSCFAKREKDGSGALLKP